MGITKTTDNYLTQGDLSKFLGISRSTLQRLQQHDKSFPAPILISKSKRWEMEVIQKWLRDQREDLNNGV